MFENEDLDSLMSLTVKAFPESTLGVVSAKCNFVDALEQKLCRRETVRLRNGLADLYGATFVSRTLSSLVFSRRELQSAK